VLATGSSDRTVRLWDLTDAKAARPLGPPLEGHRSSVVNLAFSADGKMLASGSSDKTIRLWDLADAGAARPLGPPLEGHRDIVRSLAFSPDGKALASGSSDRTIRLWDLADAKAAKPLGPPLEGHRFSVVNLAFSADGKALTSGCLDGTGRLWEVKKYGFESLKDQVRRMVRRNFTWEEWQSYFPNQIYRKTCPNLPAPVTAVLAQAKDYSLTGRTEDARLAYTQAVQMAREVEDSGTNNSICWFGSLDGFAELVLPAGERAVELAPDNFHYRDTRGLARALTGDRRGAAEDFKSFVQRSREEDERLKLNRWEKPREQREAWIRQLRAGQNPFDEATLKAIRNQ
jgi:WD40 repeat protein